MVCPPSSSSYTPELRHPGFASKCSDEYRKSSRISARLPGEGFSSMRETTMISPYRRALDGAEFQGTLHRTEVQFCPHRRGCSVHSRRQLKAKYVDKEPRQSGRARRKVRRATFRLQDDISPFLSGFWICKRRIVEKRVEGFIPSVIAAPAGPLIRQLAFSSVERMCWVSASFSVRVVAMFNALGS